jgi:glucose/mannose transport system permease protein
LLPDYSFAGFHQYVELWSNLRWNIAYTNLFVFSALYVVGTMAIGLLLAILLDQRVRAEAVWRTIYLYPLAISFVVTGTVWRWLLSPSTGIESLMHQMGWASFKFDWLVQREMAIYCVVITGVWQASGFVMALFLAGLRSVDPDLVKAAQIDGASMPRIYRRIILPAIAPIFVAVLVVLLQFAIKTFDLVLALTQGGPGIATTVPAIYVYDLLFQRGQMAEGAAAAMMILFALSLVLVPYTIWLNLRQRREARRA